MGTKRVWNVWIINGMGTGIDRLNGANKERMETHLDEHEWKHIDISLPVEWRTDIEISQVVHKASQGKKSNSILPLLCRESGFAP